MIYARPRNVIATLEDGSKLCQAVLYAEHVPETLPTSGNDIVGMHKDDKFAAGSCLICTADKEVYLVGEDEGEFSLWRSY